MQALRPEDAIVSTYREHGHALARGMPAGSVMAEMFGKQEGCSRGRGGSMHLFDQSARFYGGNAVVGGGLPIAVGLALADKMRSQPHVTCCFFGDGAVAEGEFHECMNLAALWKLPVLFVCENNRYAMGTRLDFSHSVTDLAKKAAATASRLSRWTEWMCWQSRKQPNRLRKRVRSGQGPYFLECRTYRFRAHSMYDPELYRDKAEVEEWKKRDPIPGSRSAASKKTERRLDRWREIERQVAKEIDEAIAFAEAGTWEPVEDLTRFVYSEKPQ